MVFIFYLYPKSNGKPLKCKNVSSVTTSCVCVCLCVRKREVEKIFLFIKDDLGCTVQHELEALIKHTK